MDTEDGANESNRSADSPPLGRPKPPDPLLAAIRARGERPPESGSSTGVFVTTVVLFVAIGASLWGWQSALFLATAIALHEIGHVLAMRFLGYKNVRMLFVPLFGGLATGVSQELDATKNAIVALAGPTFGLLTVAVVLAASIVTGTPTPWLAGFAWTSLFLNAFNMLPIVPLDGGQVANETLFSRYPVLELIFRILAMIALVGLGFLLHSWVLALVAALMAISTPIAFRRARIIRDARRDPGWQTRELDSDAVAELRHFVGMLFAAMPPEKYEARMADHVHGFWLAIRKRFPSAGVATALIVVYLFIGLVLFPVTGVLLYALVGKPA